ncbi:hypothetical protein HHX47_DHR2000031 [Lentinula edodes]|nr:hypothetical protein HHX47_DHR2000031 [Lentinula edodes]
MTVLLVALRYLEIVRFQIFDIARSGEDQHVETSIATRITVTTDNVLERSRITSVVNDSRDDDVHARNITDTSYQIIDEERLPSPLPPLPLLPSPLLCPRRTFLSSIILATKFLHDKSYTNRAWGALCQLPPREISRCERALGNALQWRLWLDREYPLPVAVFTAVNTPLVTSHSLRTRREDTEMRDNAQYVASGNGCTTLN